MVSTAEMSVLLERREGSLTMIWRRRKSVDAPLRAVAKIGRDLEQVACLLESSSLGFGQPRPIGPDGQGGIQMYLARGTAARMIAVMAAGIYS